MKNKNIWCIVFGCLIVGLLLILFSLPLVPGCDLVHTVADVKIEANNSSNLYELKVDVVVLRPVSLRRHPKLVVIDSRNCKYFEDEILVHIRKGSKVKIISFEEIWSLSTWYGFTSHIVVLGSVINIDDICAEDIMLDVSALFYFTGSAVRPNYKLIANSQSEDSMLYDKESNFGQSRSGMLSKSRLN